MIAIGFIGASLFFGDGIITPAISVLSAVEGLSIATDVFDRSLCLLQLPLSSRCFGAKARYGVCR